MKYSNTRYNIYKCKYETKDKPCKGFNIKRDDLEKIIIESFILLKEYLNKEKLLNKTFDRELFNKVFSKIYIGKYNNGVIDIKLLMHDYLNHGGTKDEIQLKYKTCMEYRKIINNHVVFLKIQKVIINVCFEEGKDGSI